TGVRNASLDLEALKERGIPVAGAANTEAKRGGTKNDSTTEHCVAMILGAARNLAADDLSVKSGGWQTSFATSLSGKVFGTVGLGRLGGRVARIMHLAFGMRVVAWSSNLTQEAADQQALALGLAVQDADGEKTFKAVSREELFKTADVASIHL